MENIRILHINKFLYPFGGAESYMFGLAEAQKNRGHEIEFWGMSDSKNIVNDNFECYADNIDFHHKNLFLLAQKSLQTIFSYKNKKKINIILDRFKPEIVHIHNYNFQLTPSILPQIKKRGIKIIQTIHDSQMVCPWHRLYNFQRETTCTKCVEGSFINCIKDKCFEGSIAKSSIGAIESHFYHQNDYYNKYIDLIISPSLFLAKLTQKRIKNKIEVLPNFSNISIDTLSKPPMENDFILYFGRISKEKGILDVLDMFNENEIKLKIIGAGPESSNIKTSKYVEYLGPKYGNELFKQIQEAKFVIQPSKWYENCPMTVIESFACGTPILASNHSGFTELIVQGQNGYLLDFSKKQKSGSFIKELMKESTSFLSKNCQQAFQEKFSKNIHLDQLEKLYKKTLHESFQST